MAAHPLVFELEAPDLTGCTPDQRVAWDLQRLGYTLEEGSTVQEGVIPAQAVSQTRQNPSTVLLTGHAAAAQYRDDKRPLQRSDYDRAFETDHLIGLYFHLILCRHQPKLHPSIQREEYRLLLDTRAHDTWILGGHFARCERDWEKVNGREDYKAWPSRSKETNHSTIPVGWSSDVEKLPNNPDVRQISYIDGSRIWVIPSHTIDAQVRTMVDDNFLTHYTHHFPFNVAVAAATTKSMARRPFEGVIGLAVPSSYAIHYASSTMALRPERRTNFIDALRTSGVAHPGVWRYYIRALPGTGFEFAKVGSIFSFLAVGDCPCEDPEPFCEEIPVVDGTFGERTDWIVKLLSIRFIGKDTDSEFVWKDKKGNGDPLDVILDIGASHTWLPGVVDHVKHMLGQPVGCGTTELHFATDWEILDRFQIVEFKFQGRKDVVVARGPAQFFLTGGYRVNELPRPGRTHAIPDGTLESMIKDPEQYIKNSLDKREYQPILGSNFFQTFVTEFSSEKHLNTRRLWLLTSPASRPPAYRGRPHSSPVALARMSLKPNQRARRLHMPRTGHAPVPADFATLLLALYMTLRREAREVALDDRSDGGMSFESRVWGTWTRICSASTHRQQASTSRISAELGAHISVEGPAGQWPDIIAMGQDQSRTLAGHALDCHPADWNLAENLLHYMPRPHRRVLSTASTAMDVRFRIALARGCSRSARSWCLHLLAAHKSLCEMGFLHGNINASNVLLYYEKPKEGPQGFLLDVELAKIESPFTNQNEMVKVAPAQKTTGVIASATTRSDRVHHGSVSAMHGAPMSGTKSFMAWEVLTALGADQEIERDAHHDVESFVWVLAYSIMRLAAMKMRKDVTVPEAATSAFEDHLKHCFSPADCIVIAALRHSAQPLFWVQQAIYEDATRQISQPLVHLFEELLSDCSDFMHFNKQKRIRMTHDRLLALLDASILRMKER
ncbi:hypothetical protein EVG20_g2969 [Dentipellis fragilis]|uniref:Fungal-type protein kinase domain-containing protein n=1 Tax=Dentipellis fragilis TaxID=205917 RepID=A0A4Y9Z5W5_9AGAM|nr:hypothetical protein EVG20_g2969 [Dentipellis fragilis]